MAKPNPKTEAPSKPEPSDAEKAAIKADREAYDEKPVRPAMAVSTDDGAISLAAQHSDEQGASYRVQMAFGTSSSDYASEALLKLANTSSSQGQPVTQAQLNAALAFVAAVDPKDEVEAALAVQMSVTNDLAMDLVRRTKHASNRAAMVEYGNLATKMQRTFTAQIEALAKLRRGGEQTVCVEHIHVYSGGQAIVGNVTTGGTDGKTDRQSHEPSASASVGPAMLGYDPLGHGVPLPDAERAEAVPVARRTRGSANGAG